MIWTEISGSTLVVQMSVVGAEATRRYYNGHRNGDCKHTFDSPTVNNLKTTASAIHNGLRVRNQQLGKNGTNFDKPLADASHKQPLDGGLPQPKTESSKQSGKNQS